MHGEVNGRPLNAGSHALHPGEAGGASALRRDRRVRRARADPQGCGAARAQAIAVGPFARLDAGAVAAHDGKTRGSITNLFGSQAAFQAETMALALNAGAWIETIKYPAPRDYPDADAWVDAFFAGHRRAGRGTAQSLP